MMERIDKLIDAYNKKAEKWGYNPIVVKNGRMINAFDEKDVNGLPFFKRLTVLFQNGYLKEDYEKINDLLNREQ